MSETWYERYPLRIEAEIAIMSNSYPQFILKADKYKQLYWDGILQTNFGTLYRVKISYPMAYPYRKPKLDVVEPEVQLNAPHRFEDGSLCVYPTSWDYKRATAPASVPLIAAWLALYEIFLRTGERW
ncbi:MAG TPA: hypothetical protein P5040_00240 [Smithella sp.]|nr:hypothetical protein [Smithella sp.]